ncbi:hypothetical protein [Hydrogenophaga crassostreae]|nr:hypothetical protein [Hydrogenophaga crassostreae]
MLNHSAICSGKPFATVARDLGAAVNPLASKQRTQFNASPDGCDSRRKAF